MNTLIALSKQVFGARYERIARSLISCIILFFAVRTAEIEVEIAASILFLTATFFSSGIMWQALTSSGNADSMTGLFMLPFENRSMTFSFILAYTGYTLITKTCPVLALFFAVRKWSATQIALSLLCACNGCFSAAAWYTMIRESVYHKKTKLLPFVILWCGILLLSVFFVQDAATISFIVSASLLLSLLKLWKTNAYVLYHPIQAKRLIRHTKKTGIISLYLLRYLLTNKNYLWNIAGLCVIACILPFLLGQFKGINVIPLGFAILCLNTPICVLLSCDPDLEQAVRVLPGQARRFGSRYCFFIFSINMIVNSVYLFSLWMQYGGVRGMEILTALLFALQSAVLSVLLEWFFPIRDRRIEADVWHHPRKYIVPCIMMLFAVLIAMWPAAIWILLYIVMAEWLGLFFPCPY